jgi:hypothetical protein
MELLAATARAWFGQSVRMFEPKRTGSHDQPLNACESAKIEGAGRHAAKVFLHLADEGFTK